MAQLVHAVAPAAEYLPAMQFDVVDDEHAVAAALEVIPVAQLVQLAAPAAEYIPKLHEAQIEPTVYLPAGQPALVPQLVAPALVDARQEVHVVAPMEEA